MGSNRGAFCGPGAGDLLPILPIEPEDAGPDTLLDHHHEHHAVTFLQRKLMVRGRRWLVPWVVVGLAWAALALAAGSHPTPAMVSVRASVTASGLPDTTLLAAPAARTPTPRPLRRHSSGVAIVYLLVLLAFFGLFLFTRNRLRRT
jgi:TRAP-type C4-dicarboxylate transport system permease small subunit